MNDNEFCRFRPPSEGKQLTWEVTRFCNLYCDHCCNDSGPRVDRTIEPPLSRMIQTAEQVAQVGVTKLYISGGEPLLKKGIFDILDAVDTDRTRIHVASNGYRLGPATVERLKHVGIAKLSISLDGCALNHDRIRGRNGAFSRTFAGIENAIKSGIRVDVSTSITPATLNDISSLADMLSEIGVPVLSFHTIMPVGRAVEHPELRISDETYTEFRKHVSDLQSRCTGSIIIDCDFDAPTSRCEAGCPAHSRLLHIDASGDVSSCSWLYKLDRNRFTLGNINDASLESLVSRRSQALEGLKTMTENCPIPLAVAWRSHNAKL